jgi:hypothetical protein
VSARSKEILYADIIEYAWSKARNPGVEGTDIDAPNDHVFKNTKAVQTDLMSPDSRSILALTQGIDVGMRTIVSAFSSYPAIELPQQVGSRPRTDSPIDIAKVAPVAKAAPAEKAQESLQSIAGKWSGDGLAASGVPFFFQYALNQNGSLRASWSSQWNVYSAEYPPGTLRVNGERFEYKDKDGLLWIITLDKDKKGRHILRGRREDGSQWQLKRDR